MSRPKLRDSFGFTKSKFRKTKALLGTQLVLTLVMVSFIQKLGQHLSLGKWLLCSTGLIRYLYPTDDELRCLAGIQKSSKSSRKKHGKDNEKTSDVFHIPRSLDFQLKKSKVVPLDIIHLRFYAEYQWLMDFSVYAAVIYAFTESYQVLFKVKDEVNLSMLWCFLVIGFAMKVLLSLTRQYFQSEESGERSTVIVTGFVYFLLAMVILIIDENNLELGLERAYQIFNKNAVSFLERQGINSSGPASKIVLKFFLAVWCGVIGALFTFPGLRMARMHRDALQYCGEKTFFKILLNLNFAMPFFLTILWVKPISRDYLTVKVFQGMARPIMSSATFESMRLLIVLLAVILHFCFMPFYLQCYLNMAYTRVEGIKKEAGRITNTDLQKRIAAIFYYLCVVALQYSAPTLICLFLTFMYKTLGGFTWTGDFLEYNNECLSENFMSPKERQVHIDDNYSIKECAHQFTLALESLKEVFTVDVFRGLFGLTTWWSYFAWFATTSVEYIAGWFKITDFYITKGPNKAENLKKKPLLWISLFQISDNIFLIVHCYIIIKFIMPMKGLTWATLKKNPSLLPLFFALSVGMGGAIFYPLRCALKSPDVTWNKTKNPEPWNEYENKQYKFYESPEAKAARLKAAQPPNV